MLIFPMIMYNANNVWEARMLDMVVMTALSLSFNKV